MNSTDKENGPDTSPAPPSQQAGSDEIRALGAVWVGGGRVVGHQGPCREDPGVGPATLVPPSGRSALKES